MKYICVNINTTGLDPIKDKITEVFMMLCEDDKELDHLHFFSNPGFDMTPEVEQISGLTNEFVKNAPPFDEMKFKVDEFLKDMPLVLFNSGFVLSFLERGLGHSLDNKIIDVGYTLARSILSYDEVKNFRFDTLCQHYGLVNNKKALEVKTHLLNDMFNKMMEDLYKKYKEKKN